MKIFLCWYFLNKENGRNIYLPTEDKIGSMKVAGAINSPNNRESLEIVGNVASANAYVRAHLVEAKTFDIAAQADIMQIMLLCKFRTLFGTKRGRLRATSAKYVPSRCFAGAKHE